MLQGAGWPPARKAAAGFPVEATCAHCQAAEGTLRHQAWQCPVILEAIGGARHEGRDLEEAAMRPTEGEQHGMCWGWQHGLPPSSFESFWCRGIPPALAATGTYAEPALKIKWVGEASAGVVFRPRGGSSPVLHAGTDGSGGVHSADPRLRRVGWSWVVLRPDGSIY